MPEHCSSSSLNCIYYFVHSTFKRTFSIFEKAWTKFTTKSCLVICCLNAWLPHSLSYAIYIQYSHDSAKFSRSFILFCRERERENSNLRCRSEILSRMPINTNEMYCTHGGNAHSILENKIEKRVSLISLYVLYTYDGSYFYTEHTLHTVQHWYCCFYCWHCDYCGGNISPSFLHNLSNLLQLQSQQVNVVYEIIFLSGLVFYLLIIFIQC